MNLKDYSARAALEKTALEAEEEAYLLSLFAKVANGLDTNTKCPEVE